MKVTTIPPPQPRASFVLELNYSEARALYNMMGNHAVATPEEKKVANDIFTALFHVGVRV
jgi:hypothetical protein